MLRLSRWTDAGRDVRRRACAGLLGMALVAAGWPARADDAAFIFRGRDYTPTGAHVVRRLTWTSTLPFDRAYANLSVAQKAEIRDQYHSLASNEEPPFPEQGLRMIFRWVDVNVDANTPRLTPGPLVVVARVDIEGDVQTVTVYKSPNAFVTAAVSQALLRTAFKPALRDGVPVTMDFLLRAELN